MIKPLKDFPSSFVWPCRSIERERIIDFVLNHGDKPQESSFILINDWPVDFSCRFTKHPTEDREVLGYSFYYFKDGLLHQIGLLIDGEDIMSHVLSYMKIGKGYKVAGYDFKTGAFEATDIAASEEQIAGVTELFDDFLESLEAAVDSPIEGIEKTLLRDNLREFRQMYIGR